MYLAWLTNLKILDLQQISSNIMVSQGTFWVNEDWNNGEEDLKEMKGIIKRSFFDHFTLTLIIVLFYIFAILIRSSQNGFQYIKDKH